ncbi:hypothetical protein [Bacillus licheniformis]|uniref:hypothetical protein n=1 Tax=Bacillus licheniformis TaxID=1402 RepID=UPI00092C3A1F|nr:hypothetical protein [Bacillus licheniformis]OJT57382.1 hypothetical protein BFP47_11790 [Bacillus licheniformis]OJT69976.1 hypothetical protein BFP46_05100 [Bacillus licheniformis]
MRYIYESKCNKKAKERANFYFTEAYNNLYEVTKHKFGITGHRLNSKDVMQTLQNEDKVTIERLDGSIYANHLF